MYAVEVIAIEQRRYVYDEEPLFSEDETQEHLAELGGDGDKGLVDCLAAMPLEGALATVLRISGLEGLLEAEGWMSVLGGSNAPLVQVIEGDDCFPSDMHRQWMELLAQAFPKSTSLPPMSVLHLEVLGDEETYEMPTSFDDTAAACRWGARLLRDLGAAEALFGEDRVVDEDGCVSVVPYARFVELSDASPDLDDFGTAKLEVATLAEFLGAVEEGSEAESAASFD